MVDGGSGSMHGEAGASLWHGETRRSPANAEPANNQARLEEVLLRTHAFSEGDARQNSAALLTMLDAIPAAADSRRERALRSFVRGRILDEGEGIGGDHVADAEEELSRAVKMDPMLGGAWNQLGTCMWKKGDFQLAHDCWQNTLLQCSDLEAHKEAIRKLSMAFRSSQGNNPDESLRLAKELISKDMADTQSWTNLGNAYMSYFFASSLDREDLFRALKAYHRSDLDGQSQDPDLHFNKGTVYRYLEDYPNAVLELLRADQLDKDLNAAEQVRQMLKLVREMHAMISCQCNIKPERLAAVLSTMGSLPWLSQPISVAGCEYSECQTIDSLSEGANGGKMVTVMIMAIPYTERPIHAVVADRESNFFAMSIYNMQEGKLKPGDFISALSPYLRLCSLPSSLPESQVDLFAATQKQQQSAQTKLGGQDGTDARNVEAGCGEPVKEGGGAGRGEGECWYRCVQLSTGQVLHNGRPCDMSYYERPRAVFTVNPASLN